MNSELKSQQDSGQVVTYQLATPADEPLFSDVAPGVFDNDIIQKHLHENLNDPRHHLAIARSEGLIVGMAVGVHYTQPDKDPQFFIDELGVAPCFQRRGIGKGLLQLLLTHAQVLGCREAWLATEADNIAARSLYASMPKCQESHALIYTFPLPMKSE